MPRIRHKSLKITLDKQTLLSYHSPERLDKAKGNSIMKEQKQMCRCAMCNGTPKIIKKKAYHIVYCSSCFQQVKDVDEEVSIEKWNKKMNKVSANIKKSNLMSGTVF